MTGLIIDASVTLAWLLDDEEDARAEAALPAFEREGGIVPQHWRYEVGNGLLTAVRRGRLTREDGMQRLRSLASMAVTIDVEVDLHTTLALAFQHDLTFYDAVYLELALRRQLPLATLDQDLADAARVVGVELVPA